MTSTIHLTNLGNDRYLATRNAAKGEDVGLLLIRTLALGASALVRQGYSYDTAVSMSVAHTFGWDVEDDADIQRCIEDEVKNFMVRNDY